MDTNQAPAYARTNAPIAAGPIITFIAKKLGWDLSVEEALLVVPIISSAYYTLGRVLESINPKFGYILGMAKQPAYADEPSPAPDKGEEVRAVVVPEGAPEPAEDPGGFDAPAYSPEGDAAP